MWLLPLLFCGYPCLSAGMFTAGEFSYLWGVLLQPIKQKGLLFSFPRVFSCTQFSTAL
jgi:hypothetical protein